MKLAKQFGYKLIIVLCMMVTFCTFIASTPVYASKVNKTDFYYSGVQKGSYSVGKSFWDTLIETLAEILDYLLGLCTMGIRMVFVGWTALFERCLTLILSAAVGDPVDVEGVSATSLFSADGWITLDAIFFNHVPLLDINFFNFEMLDGYTATGQKKEEEAPVAGDEETHDAPMIIDTDKDDEVVGNVQIKTVQGKTNNLLADPPSDDNLIIILKKAVAGWYYTLRTISIMVMLVLLFFVGIQMAMKSSATDKAVYKKMLTDWVVSMILVFSIHYIMLFIINFNESLISGLEHLRTGATPMAVYEYGLEERAARPITNEELEFTLYDEVKTRAYDVKLTVGTTGMVMYMVLVYYAWKYTFIYLKRYLTVAVLVIMAPLVAVSYAYNKVRTGRATIFTKWLKEFTFIVILQTVHAIIYLVFVQTALAISLASISGFILCLVLFNFMSKAEGIFRKIFGITGGGAGLTDDIASGAGLKETLQGVKNTMVGMAGGKLAVSYTKGVAKIMTKPIRLAGDTAFKAGMKHRAKRLDENLDEEIEKHHLSGEKGKIRDYKDLRSAIKKRRINTLHYGNILKHIESGEINLAELEKEISELKVGQQIQDENGTFVGLVDEEYIAGRKKELTELQFISSLSPEEKTQWMEEYDALHDKHGNLKRLSIYMSDKWQDIIDPTNYVHKNVHRREDGSKYITYDAVEKQGEYGNVHGRFFTWKFGKTVDGASHRLAKKLKWENIAGLNKEEKEALKAQKELIKNEIVGFAGIFAGLPLLVAEPQVGMVAMTVGIQNTSKAHTSQGGKRRKALSHYTMDEQGNYTFNRFEGSSTRTMAVGAQIMAERQVEQIEKSRLVEESKMKKRVRKILSAKFPERTRDARTAARAAGVGMTATSYVLDTLKVVPLAKAAMWSSPAIAAAAVGSMATFRLVGDTRTVRRVQDNAWSRYHDTIRAARKADAKALEKDEKSAKTSDYMSIFADRYLEMEHDATAIEAEQHASEFADEYAILLASLREDVDNKTEEEVVRDLGYEEPIEVTGTTPEGRPIISVESENKLIEDAIIECAEKSGIMDVSEIVVEDKMDDIANIIETKLITQGLIERDEHVEVIIQDLEKKVKDRQVQIEKDGRNTTAVEEKMAGDAIISVMQEQGITDPTQVSEEQVLQRYTETYEETHQESLRASEQTNSVLEGLTTQKAETMKATQQTPGVETAQVVDLEAPKAVDVEEIKANARNAIKARKSVFADRAKKKQDDQVVAAMRETLKKKKELDLDTQILAQQERLESVAQGVGDIVANENGGANPFMDAGVTLTTGGTTPGEVQVAAQPGTAQPGTMQNRPMSTVAPGGTGTEVDPVTGLPKQTPTNPFGTIPMPTVNPQESSSDEIIKMLQLQTQLHQDKQKMAFVSAKITGNRDEKVRLYQELRASEPDGSRRINQAADGSRRANTRTDGSRAADSRLDGTRAASSRIDGSRRVTGASSRGAKKNQRINMNTEISEILRIKKQEMNNNMGMV